MTYTIHQADVLEALRGMDADSYSGCLTDPPYGLTTDGGKTGFMGHAWDKGVPPVEVWREVLRVLKPGAYLLAFGGTRTFHRLTCAIEDAGFEIRDSIAQFFDQDAATQAFLAGLSPEQRKDFDRAFVGSPIECYLYGSGFPKSHDVSKAIDREAGAMRGLVERERPDGKRTGHATTGFVAGATDSSLKRSDVALTEAARQWSGYGSALKPAHEPVILARKPLAGTVAQNVQRWGCGALAIDASRVGTTADERQVIDRRSGAGRGAMFTHMGREEGERFTSSPLGRWPANVILSHSPDCVEVGTREVVSRGGHRGTSPNVGYNGGLACNGEPTGPGSTIDGTKYMRAETVAKFDCAPGCPVAALDRQSGHLHGAGSRQGPQAKWSPAKAEGWGNIGTGPSGARFGDSGGASRFFKTCSFSQDEVVFSRAMAMLSECNFDHASIANAHSPQSKPRADSALSDAVALVSQGATRLLGWSGLSTVATPSESKALSATLIATILSFGEGSSQEPQRERSFPSGSRASVAQPQRRTDTTTITISHWRSDGSAEPVTFSIMPGRSERGEVASSRFMYCAKASRKERDAGVEGGASHPCVKPLALTTYLARLILPPVEGARLLVPFCGSGSEMLGGLRAGWSHVEGIDSWGVAVKIAKARLAHHEAQAEPANDAAGQLTLDGVGT